MSKTPPGPNELRLRELREQRMAAAAKPKKKGKIPYAGKVRGAREATYGNANSTKAKKP